MKKILFLIIGIAILSYLFYSKIDFDQFLSAINDKISFDLFVLLFLGINIQQLARAIRFRLIYNFLKEEKISYLRSFRVTSASFFIALATPNKLGDNLRALFFKKNRSLVTEITAYEYLLDLIMAILLPISSIYILYFTNILVNASILALMICIVILLKLGRKLINLFDTNKKMERINIFISKVTHIHLTIRQNPLLITKILASTIFFHFVYFIIQFIILMQLNSEISFLEVMAASGSSFLAGAFSMIPMGLGVRDFTSYSFLEYFGVEAASAASAVIIMRAVTLSLAITSSINYFISIIFFEKIKK